MKQSEKLLAGFLAICMLLVMVPWSLPAYAETTETPIDRIEFEPMTFIENCNGRLESSYDEESESWQEYFHYNLYPTFTVYFKDGTSKSCTANDWIEYEGIPYYLNFIQDYNHQLTLGANTVNCTLMNFETAFTVNIVENPIERVEIETMEIIENTGGWFDSYWDDETQSYIDYYYYEMYPDFTVYFKDGTSISNESGRRYIIYNGVEYALDDDQHRGNPLSLGTNTVGASLMGFDTTFEVRIIESPIERIEFEPLQIFENTNGDWDFYYDEETGEHIEYYHYWLNPTYTVYFTDGTSRTYEGCSYIEYNGFEYTIDFRQGSENQLTLGTNTVTCSILNYETSFEVTVIDTLVERIEFKPLELIQNTTGYWENYYDHETGEYKEYFYYWIHPQYTVHLKDGTVLTSDADGNVQYNGAWYGVDYLQNEENQLTVGSNPLSIELMGYKTTMTVDVIESPIERIEFEPLELVENANGYWESYYDYDSESWKEYYYYHITPSYTVYFTNGTSETYEDSRWIQYNGYEYYLDCIQNHYSYLTPGVNHVRASVLGYETTFEVTVTESPIERIEFESLELIENSGGYWETYRDEETGETKEYYHYWLYPQYTAYLNDGTVLTSDADGDIRYNGSWYGVEYDQNPENRLTLGANTINGNILGFEVSFNVNIIESPFASLEILSVDSIHQNDYTGWTEDMDGNRIYLYDIPIFTYKVTLKDGTSFTKSSDEEWDDYLSADAYQHEDPWTIGGINEFHVNYADLQATGYVTMLEPVYFDYIEQNGGIYITGCKLPDATVTIPEEIDGLPVVGVLWLDGVFNTLEHLILPDSVINLNEQGFGNLPNLKTITIGSGVTYLTVEMLEHYPNLEAVYISENNPAFTDVDGIVYNKAIDTLVFYPLPANAENLDYYVPATVTNIDAISGAKYAELNIIFDENSTAYKTIDGVTYSADMTRIISCQRDKTGTFIMPETVTEISANAFSDCTGLTEIVVSPNVTQIAYSAFMNCSALSSISLPDSVIAIDDYAFTNCEALTKVELPQELQVIGESAFSNTALTALTLPDSVLGIMSYAFNGTEIATLNLGNSLQFIGDRAFYGIPIQTLTLPDSFGESGSEIFANCKKLTEIHFGSGLMGISSRSFANCTALKSVTLPKNIMYVHNGAFNGCSSLEKVEFKSDEVYFGDYVFMNCALKTLKLGNKVEAISEFGFAGNDFTELTLPDSVTHIAYSAFKNCTDLAKIDIPQSTVSIGDNAFDNTAWYEAQQDGAIYLEHILYDYKNYVAGQNILEIKPGTTVIADGALDSQYKLEHITLPQGLTNIGSYAFYQCDNLQELFIPEGVKEIPYGAFFRCDSLTSLVLPSTIEYIDYCAYDTALEHILFMGTEKQWSTLYIDYELRDVPVHFGTPEVLKKKTATCTTPGYTVYGCPDCDAEHIQYTELAGHTPSGKPTVTAPTCSAYGSESGYCTTCKANYTIELPKTEHTYANGGCTACGLAEIRSAHPYAEDMDQTWTYTETGANQIAITFHPMTQLEGDNYDTLTIYDGADNVIGTYCGFELAGATVVVPGDTAKIRFKTNESYNYYGFEVTDIVAEHVLSSNNVELATKPNTLDPEVELIAEVTEIAPEVQRPAGMEESQTFAYDITLEKNGETIQPDGNVQVTLPVPETMDGSSCQVFHLADDGTWTNMNASYNGGKLTFTTDHFSQYVILEAFDTASAVRIMQHLIGMDVDINVGAIDRNGDATLTIADAVLLLRSLL